MSHISMETPVERALECYRLDEFDYGFEDNDENLGDSVKNKIPELLKAFDTNRVVILTGDTGCGKTTQIPRLLMPYFPTIICTQPRRLAVIQTAKRIARGLRCALGSVVGYTIRFENVSSPNTILRIVTEGILLNEIAHGSYFSDLIIIDEAHERTVNIDLLLGYFKNVLLKNENGPKLLIMSATLQTDKLIKYFNDCPLVQINHRRFKIDHFYLKDDYGLVVNEKCAETALKILKKNPNGGDILIFLPGQGEIQETASILSDLCRENGIGDNDVKILKLFSLLPQDEQNLIFDRDRRKIILSTNIAETSVTIVNIKFIIDSGRVKIMKKASGAQTLSTVLISKAQAKQRAGRAGRTEPGVVYRLFTRQFYDEEMNDDQEPELLRTDLSRIVLHLKKLGVENIFEFEFIDKPCELEMGLAVRFLKRLGAIDETDDKLTEIGEMISSMPLDPEMGRTLHEANRLGCILSVSTILAFLNHPNMFVVPKIQDSDRFLAVKDEFRHEKGDFYTFLNIYEAWTRSNFSHSFLKMNFLNVKVMHEIYKERTLFLKFYPKSFKDDRENIERAFCAGFFQHVAKRMDRNRYKILIGEDDKYYGIDKRDGLYKQNPSFILFHHLYSITETVKVMKFCLEIDRESYEWAIQNDKITPTNGEFGNKKQEA